jgi:hypothetical protein
VTVGRIFPCPTIAINGTGQTRSLKEYLAHATSIIRGHKLGYLLSDSEDAISYVANWLMRADLEYNVARDRSPHSGTKWRIGAY